MNSNALIICGFAGIGKTTLEKEYKSKGIRIIDLESSDYHWIYDNEKIESMDKEQRKATTQRTLNPEWPYNYIQAIAKAMNDYDIILTSLDIEMRKGLRQNNILYFVAYPSKDSKQEYIQRYRNRGNNEAFVALIESNFDQWVDALEKGEKRQIIIPKGKFLADCFSLNIINENHATLELNPAVATVEFRF